MSDETLATPPEEPVAALPLNVEEVLEEYRRRQMIEHMTGPMVSVIVHLVILVICFFFMVAPVDVTPRDYEVEIKDIQVKELEVKTQEIMQKVAQTQDNMPVPTVAPPAAAGDSEGGDVTNNFDTSMASADNSIVEGMSDVNFMDGSPIRIAGVYSGRTAGGRAKMMGSGPGGGGGRGNGPTLITEASVLRALRWLKENQSPDGSWAPSQPVAMSGLALLAFLAHGETPSPECKEFGETVNKGLQWLQTRMMAAPIGEPYTNAIATYALAEAYGMTKIPALKPAMEKGLAVIIKGQQDKGGWDYNYAKGQRWDLSVGGWQIQALKAGFIAGAEAPGLAEALEKSMTYLQQHAYSKKSNSFCYSNDGGARLSMQGVGALCMQLMGLGKNEEVQAAITAISQKPINWVDETRATGGDGNQVCYAWYYQTQAMFYAGIVYWKPWNAAMSIELPKNQKPDGHWESPPSAKAGGKAAPNYDPFYNTSLACLMLEVYYRFLPTYKIDLNEKKEGDSILDWGTGGSAKKDAGG